MKVLITGDCHAGILKRGQRDLVSKGEWPQQVDLIIRPLGVGKFFPTSFFIDKGDHAEICNLEYRKRFNHFPPSEMKNSDVVYGLSAPLHTARVRLHQDWSKFVPSQFVLNEAPISNALLRQIILDDSQYLLKFIDIILRTQKNLFVIEPPRPFKHSLKLIRPEVSNYIDCYYRNFIKQELKLRNVPIIAVSSELYDETGFMLERYRHFNEKNRYNGNAEFGQLMMKEILEFLI